MRERPILFSSPMVRAILDGSKRMTRRMMKPQPVIELANLATCPYGQPGDRLWVRETFVDGFKMDGNGMFALDASGEQIPEVWYRATSPGLEWFDGESDRPTGPPWKPSIHMPRKHCRITLEVVSVRVERLQEISTADCIAEGAHGGHGSIPGYIYAAQPQEHFRHIWESINGAGSWERDKDKWVWCISFRRIQ